MGRLVVWEPKVVLVVNCVLLDPGPTGNQPGDEETSLGKALVELVSQGK